METIIMTTIIAMMGVVRISETTIGGLMTGGVRVSIDLPLIIIKASVIDSRIDMSIGRSSMRGTKGMMNNSVVSNTESAMRNRVGSHSTSIEGDPQLSQTPQTLTHKTRDRP